MSSATSHKTEKFPSRLSAKYTEQQWAAAVVQTNAAEMTMWGEKGPCF